MKQIIQNIRSGKLSVEAIPEPCVAPGEVLIANQASLVSAGTEKMIMDLAKKSLLGKARERPDQVKRVLQKIRTEGLFETIDSVKKKLDEPMTMGYSSAGVVLACGAGVQQFKPGDRVASNGPHAEVVSVPENLCARVPENVPPEQAAFGVLGSIALQGVRLAKCQLGETVLVIGLGLVGQLTAQLLRAAGVRVIGTDLDTGRCELAVKMGAEIAKPGIGAADVESLTQGLGADCVLITASTKSNAPIELAAASVRKKGRVVLVGVVGLELDRRPFYFKECEFVVSCSYGPGRYDPEYENRGHDYPAAYVRWTEQRNIQAILDLMASGSLEVDPLISHRFAIEDAEQAYRLIESGSEPYLGIVLQYPEITERKPEQTVVLRPRRSADGKSLSETPETPSPNLSPEDGGEGFKIGQKAYTHRKTPSPAENLESRGSPEDGGEGHAMGTRIRFGALGAGNFARMVLLPAIEKSAQFEPVSLCTAKGVSGTHSGQAGGFEISTTDEDQIFGDDSISTVFSITRHDQHARNVLKAIEAGKHIFVEKPLCLTVGELTEIELALADKSSPPIVMVGFNRRFSPAARQLRSFFERTMEPLAVSIRFNAGDIPSDHWTQHDTEGGGRIVGEACHAIDLATYLTGSVPVRVYAESVGKPDAQAITDDQCFITLRHANGCISNIGYLAGGDKAFAKERVEVIGGGMVGVIEDFRKTILCVSGKTTTKKYKMDKGHQQEVREFADCIVNGSDGPISWDELCAVALASILSVQSLREGMPIDL